ncbi:MAG TPA: twin-arginine translocation signal domain-containing protein, partial [Rhizomicrobium sp.]|nr:twin-arginine translocation signal domain-containing protein [Rhizomicrobium sp.]
MLIRSRPGWFLPENAATPEEAFFNRRNLIKGAGAIAASVALASCDSRTAKAGKPEPDPSAKYYPAKRNAAFKLDRAISPEKVVETYNNY